MVKRGRYSICSSRLNKRINDNLAVYTGIWILARIGLEGNEMADRYAKSATRQISMAVT